MTKIPLIRESDQTQNCIGIVRHGNSSENIDPNRQILKTMVKRSTDQKLRLRTFDARHEKIETGAVVKSQKGLSGVERGKRYLLPVERKKGSVRKETNVVSGMRVTIVQSRH